LKGLMMAVICFMSQVQSEKIKLEIDW